MRVRRSGAAAPMDPGTVSFARLGVLAVVGVAAAVVALPHLVAAQPAAPVPQPIGPVIPVGSDEVPTRQLRVPRCY